MPSAFPNLERLRAASSLKDMALAAIKKAMAANQFEPGVLYTEAAITSRLGISRTPVREALLQLASRGLIAYIPRKGFRIPRLTEKDVADLFELRLGLELTVIRLILPALTPAALARIERAFLEYKRTAQKREPLASLQANMTFHSSLAKLTANAYLIGALEDIQHLTNLAGFRSLEVDSRTSEAIAEHARIVAALKRRSLDGALCEMERHIRTTGERVLARLRAAPRARRAGPLHPARPGPSFTAA